MTKIASNLQIDSARLWETIHETAKFGATPKGGVRRLTLGPEDKQVRDWFRKACEAAGLEVHVDTLGSMFGLRKGRDMSKPPVGLGSHLDTQPTGGKFDGVLGTLAALEVVRTLNDAGIETETPICIVNWTNEEGSRFAPAMMASAAYVGDFTTDDILSRKDAEGVTVAEALDSIGYRGAHPVGTQKFTSFVELHIEQGPILEAENKIIGVVDSYGYWPLVRQVFSHRVFRPAIGQPADEAEIGRGLAGAAKVLAALEALAVPDAFLVGPDLSLADLHLGAMIAYFAAAPEGSALLHNHPRLAAWWLHLNRRPSLAATDPGLPNA